MGVSKQQRIKFLAVCQCGCGKIFTPFPTYKSGGLSYPKYKRGHGQHNRKNQFGNKPVWNKGLSKETCPTLSRMGFQSGEKHWNFKKELNPDWFSENFNPVEFAKQYQQIPRSRGTRKIFGKFRDAILARDNYTCKDCGYKWDQKDDPNKIHVHHVKHSKIFPLLIFDPKNVVIVCRDCHWTYHKHK